MNLNYLQAALPKLDLNLKSNSLECKSSSSDTYVAASTTDASSISTGSIVSAGGVGIAKKLIVGTTIYGRATNPVSLGKYTCHNSVSLSGTTEISLLTGAASSGSLNYPANSINVGMLMRISTLFTGAQLSVGQTVTFRLKTAGIAYATLVWTPSVSSNVAFKIDIETFIRDIAMTNMTLFTTNSGSLVHSYTNAGANFDKTLSNTIDFTAQFSAVNADSIRMERFVIEDVYHE